MAKQDKLLMKTRSISDENFARLSALFPNAITETVDENGQVIRAIDKDILEQEINVQVIGGGKSGISLLGLINEKAFF